MLHLVSEAGAAAGTRIMSVINRSLIMNCGDPLAYMFRPSAEQLELPVGLFRDCEARAVEVVFALVEPVTVRGLFHPFADDVGIGTFAPHALAPFAAVGDAAVTLADQAHGVLGLARRMRAQPF